MYDNNNVTVMGGSHGGYLTAFLSAKFPKMFKAAILRNPVIDLPSKFANNSLFMRFIRHVGNIRHI
jgi:acylaminoacyl-peptidase